jgi:predicted mannosyl-3-phosphoglycerate phosphatase (HAD superfamily)
VPYRNLNEIAKEIYKEIREADEKYIVINNKREKIIEIEIIYLRETLNMPPRFKITTEKGTVLLLTPARFLRKKYIVIKDGKEKTIIGV